MGSSNFYIRSLICQLLEISFLSHVSYFKPKVNSCLCETFIIKRWSFPDSSVGRESACHAGDPSSIPGLGRSAGEGKGYPLQYSGLENSMDCIVHGIAKCRTRLSDFHFIIRLWFNINMLESSLFPLAKRWQERPQHSQSKPFILHSSCNTNASFQGRPCSQGIVATGTGATLTQPLSGWDPPDGAR